MPLYGDIKLELIDLDNSSGNPMLNTVFSEGTLSNQLGCLQTDFELKFNSPRDMFSAPFMMRALGTGSCGSGFIPNPRMLYNINNITGDNYSWVASNRASRMIANGLEISGQNTGECGEITSPYYGNQSISSFRELADGGVIVPTYGNLRSRIDLIRLRQSEFQGYQNINSGNQQAWISYDVSSGATNKQLFAYSLEILERISGFQDSGTNFIINQYQPSELVFYSGFLQNSLCNNISLLLNSTGLTCVVEDTDDDSPLEKCITSGLSQDKVNQQIKEFLSGVLEDQSNQGTLFGNPVDDSEIKQSSVELQYVTYKGQINFNNPYSGDSISFSPYSYDYTGEYSRIYNVNPPYPTTGFNWTFGVDYTGIDQLISLINLKLSGINFPLWIKDIDCKDTSLSGIYETGNLLFAYKNDNNTILIESTRIGPAGNYSWNFYEAPRPQAQKPDLNSIQYMLPSTVRLQAANVYGSWVDLDVHSGVKWGDVKPIVVRQTLYDAYTGFPTGQNGLNDSNPTSGDATISGAVTKQLIYEAEVSGRNKCGKPFDKKINFYAVPSGFDCNDTGNKDITHDSNINGDGGEGVIPRPVDYFFLKTGWKFNNTTPYNYYRIVLDSFQVGDSAANTSKDNTFFINSINLYGATSGTLLHSTSACLVGSTYSGEIQGYTSGVLTGVINGQADSSGLMQLLNSVVTGTPNGNGFVKFQYSSGKATTPFTGLVFATVTGTGFYNVPVQGFFYNSGSQCVQFTKNVSGFIAGSGTLFGGPYNVINQNALSSITSVQIVSGSTPSLLTGIIPNFNFNFTDIPSFANATGTVSYTLTTGDGGSVNIVQDIAVNPAGCFSIAVSGTTPAKSVLKYNSPASGDSVFINGNVIIYSTGTNDFAPSYFNNIGTLTNIINSGAFGATGFNDGINVYLTATDSLGTSGNSITTSSIGSTGRPFFYGPTFSGGVTTHYNLSPQNVFTGEVNTILTAVNFFSGLASGNITGQIKQLDFIRTFTGLWNLTTGDQDFRANNWVTGAGSKLQNSGFVPLGIYSGQPEKLPILISYLNNPLVVSNDFALLKVIAPNSSTGVSYVISGQY